MPRLIKSYPTGKIFNFLKPRGQNRAQMLSSEVIILENIMVRFILFTIFTI